MPKNPDFEKVHKQFVGKYGDKQGDTLYYAWLNSFDPPLDDTKPMPDKLPPKKKGESIEPPTIIRTKNNPADFAPFVKLFIPNAEKLLESLSSGEVYFVPAIHVGTTGFPGMTDAEGFPRLRRYDEDELMRAARTLIGKPVNLNHVKYPDASKNFVIWAEYDTQTQGVMSYVYVEDKEINLLYDEGQINAASVEYAALDLPRFDGIAPTGILFSGLALLTKDVIPGDPKTSVDKSGFPLNSMQIARSLVQGESAKSAEGLKVMSEMEGKKKDEQSTEIKEAEWDAAYINDLPDSAFAYIEPGGTKDSEGKTSPRSMRHLPYRKKDGSVDLPHLRNALARVDQTDLSPAIKAKIRAHLQSLASDYLKTAQEILAPLLVEIVETQANVVIEATTKITEALSPTAKVDNPERKDADKKEPDKQEIKDNTSVPTKEAEVSKATDEASKALEASKVSEVKDKEAEGKKEGEETTGKKVEDKEPPKGQSQAPKEPSHGVGLVANPILPNPAPATVKELKHKAFLNYLDKVVAGQSLHERHVVDLVHEELDNE